MQLSSTSPVMRTVTNVNPGIVPPFLADAATRPPLTRGGDTSRYDHGHGHGHVNATGSGVITRDQMDPQQAELADRVEKKTQEVLAHMRGLGITAAEGASKITIQLAPGFDNAAYDPEQDAMIIGIDAARGTTFADGGDVVAHELGHRVLEKTLGGVTFDPNAEMNAIHEHVGDVFAMSFDQDDWQLGEDVGGPFRDFAHPGSMGDPESYGEALQGIKDGSLMVQQPVGDGRIIKMPDWHSIAGVPNRAAAMIGEKIGRDELAKLYVHALRSNVSASDDLGKFAVAITKSAAEVYGPDSAEAHETSDAWKAVGLLDTPAEAPAAA